MTPGAAFAPGDVLGERYTLKKTEWSSVFGPVWLARDRVLDRAVFVQVLSPAAAGEQHARRAFLKTAARIAQIPHPGLLQVFDIGEDPPFAVLEFAGGGSLADRLRAGPLRPTDAARGALALARGLEALHERGAWLACLSPSNVLFDDEGRAKILALAATDAWRSIPGADATVEQPPGYRAREGDAAPADADRFALAALTYHMLTGKAPSSPPAPARSVRREVPADIDSLLRRALDPRPEVRPSMDEFEAALAPHARFVPPEARQPRFSGSEFRWLAPVVLILVLGGLAATFGVRIVQDLADRTRDASPTPTAPAAAGASLEVGRVAPFDPEANGGNGEENDDDAPNAIDDDALTVWRTKDYAERDLAPKDGVGLLIDLGRPVDLARIRVRSTLAGWKAQIRVADEEGRRAEDFRQLTTFTAGRDDQISLPDRTTARYVLLWIVELAEHPGGGNLPFRAEVAEVEFFAR